MIVEFSSLKACMDSALESLRRSTTVPVDRQDRRFLRDAAFADAMLALVGVGVKSAESSVSSDDMNTFREEIVQFIDADTDALYCYIDDSVEYVLNRSIDEWDEVCIRRSAIQLLRDDYPGGVQLFSDEDDRLVKEMDDLILENYSVAEPLAEFQILTTLPKSHWWWSTVRTNSDS